MLDGVTVGDEIAQGGFGDVYRGTLGRQQVAIKIMRQNGRNIERAIMVSVPRVRTPFNLNVDMFLYRQLLVRL